MKANHSWLALILIALLNGAAAGAQTFSSGSNGSDGALDLTGQSGTIVFNPANFNPPLDQDHDNVYHFTTIKIPSNVVVRLSGGILGIKPLVWLASGNVEIAGTLDLDGATGHPVGGPRIPADAGAGGYPGGIGETSTTPARSGQGPGGGQPNGGAGHVAAGGGGTGVGGNAYGNDFLIPLLGGSGGGGGRTTNSAGGGGGGGAILIASSTSILISGFGVISARGGAGCPSFSGGTAVGGGGSGGAIRLIAPVVAKEPNTSLLATGSVTCSNTTSGVGSEGRIRIEAYQKSLPGTIQPTPTVATPGLIFPPASAPAVRITSIGGIAVPASPTASFITPDVTLDNATSVTIQLAASKVPVGAVVHLTLTPETGSIQTVDSTPLAGTFDSSTATATVTIPHGFSRFSVQASWTP